MLPLGVQVTQLEVLRETEPEIHSGEAIAGMGVLTQQPERELEIVDEAAAEAGAVLLPLVLPDGCSSD